MRSGGAGPRGWAAIGSGALLTLLLLAGATAHTTFGPAPAASFHTQMPTLTMEDHSGRLGSLGNYPASLSAPSGPGPCSPVLENARCSSAGVRPGIPAGASAMLPEAGAPVGSGWFNVSGSSRPHSCEDCLGQAFLSSGYNVGQQQLSGPGLNNCTFSEQVGDWWNWTHCGSSEQAYPSLTAVASFPFNYLNNQFPFGNYSLLGLAAPNETWVFAPNVSSTGCGCWSVLHTNNSPPVRPGDVLEDEGSMVVLFGSEFWGDAYHPITWGFVWWPTNSPPYWVNLTSPVSPSARGDPGFVGGADGGLLFGGSSLSGAQRTFGDTWIFVEDSRTSGHWVNLTANLTASPPPRASPAMSAMGPTESSILMFGGLSIDPPAPSVLLNDTWVFSTDSNNWTNMSSGPAPPPRSAALLNWEDGSALGPAWVLLFGGNSTSGPLNDTWVYAGAGYVPFVDLGVTDNLPASGEVDVGTKIAFDVSTVSGGGPPPFNYTWTFSDGTRIFGRNISRVVTTPTSTGGGGVVLEINSSAGLPCYAAISFSVNADPSVQISGSGLEEPLTTGQSLSFVPVLTGGTPPYLVHWSFGDGTTINDTQVGPENHTYSRSGLYVVQLSVQDLNGRSSNASRSIPIYDPLVIESVTTSPIAVTLGTPMNFSAQVSGGVPPYSYSWSFGDGGVGGNLSNITHAFETNGPFTVVLSVSDSVGLRANRSIDVSILLGVDAQPSSVSGTAPFTIEFSAKATGGVPAYSYSWSFGDGDVSYQENSSHTYPDSGSYKVTLLVGDSAGHSVERNWTIAVAPALGTPAVNRLLLTEISLAIGLVVVAALVLLLYTRRTNGSKPFFAEEVPAGEVVAGYAVSSPRPLPDKTASGGEFGQSEKKGGGDREAQDSLEDLF
jgi:PKD repeat protein